MKLIICLISFICIYINEVNAQAFNKNEFNDFENNFALGVTIGFSHHTQTQKRYPIIEVVPRKYWGRLVISGALLISGTTEGEEPVIFQARAGWTIWHGLTPFIGGAKQVVSNDIKDHPGNKSYLSYGVEYIYRGKGDGFISTSVLKNENRLFINIGLGMFIN